MGIVSSNSKKKLKYLKNTVPCRKKIVTIKELKIGRKGAEIFLATFDSPQFASHSVASKFWLGVPS